MRSSQIGRDRSEFYEGDADPTTRADSFFPSEMSVAMIIRDATFKSSKGSWGDKAVQRNWTRRNRFRLCIFFG